MRFFLLLLLMMLFTGFSMTGQTPHVDELLQQVKNRSDDTVKVNQMITLARQIQYSDPAKTNQLLQDILKVSEAIHYNLGKAAYYGFKAAAYTNQMQLDSAKISNDRALKFIKRDNSIVAKNQLATIYNTYGVIYQQQQLYDLAASMYLKVVKLCDETGNHNRKTFAYCNLSVLYSFINDTIKTDRYARLAVAEAKHTGDTILILRSTLTILNNFAQYHRYDSIPGYAIPALKMATDKSDIRSKAKLLHIIGDYQSQNDKLRDSANLSFQQALQLYRQLSSPYDEAIALHSIGENYLNQNKYTSAIENLEQAIKIEDELGLLQLKTETLKSLSTAEAKNGNASRAYKFLNEYVTLNDSLAKKTNEEIVQTLETKYQLQKREDTILLQLASIKQKNTLNYILIGSAAGLLIISLLSYRNYRNRQKLQQQRISELETEKQLLATQSLLKGQEDERSRLAKDLHDGLGGLLSGVKLQLGAMKGNLILTEEHGRAFNNALNKLDDSINEMRRVAHNMMPEALINLGLQQALHDYCDGLSESQPFTINCEFYGLEQRMEPSIEIVVYRIVQELLNNAVKHANATTILAQVIRRNNNLSITVEDNGKGFDATQLDTMRTAGLRNIQSRVNYLHGQIDVQSSPGKGTSVHIDCLIEDHG